MRRFDIEWGYMGTRHIEHELGEWVRYQDALAHYSKELDHAYAEGRKDEAEEHSLVWLETLRHIHTKLASNLAFDMNGVPETHWDAIAAALVRDISAVISSKGQS